MVSATFDFDPADAAAAWQACGFPEPTVGLVQRVRYALSWAQSVPLPAADMYWWVRRMRHDWTLPASPDLLIDLVRSGVSQSGLQGMRAGGSSMSLSDVAGEYFVELCAVPVSYTLMQRAGRLNERKAARHVQRTRDQLADGRRLSVITRCVTHTD